MGLWGEWRLPLCSDELFLLVRATLNLAAAERVGATITKKKELFIIRGYRRSYGYCKSKDYFLFCQPLTQCATRTAPLMGLCYKNIFSFRGLTKKEINVIMELRRKVWGQVCSGRERNEVLIYFCGRWFGNQII